MEGWWDCGCEWLPCFCEWIPSFWSVGGGLPAWLQPRELRQSLGSLCFDVWGGGCRVRGGGVQGRGGLGTCLLLRSFCPLGMGPFWNPDANPVLLSLSPLAICFSHRSVLLLLRDRAEVGSRSRCWQPHRGCPQHSLDKAGEQLASPSTGHRREGRWVRRTRSSQGQAQCCQGPNSELLGLLLP